MFLFLSLSFHTSTTVVHLFSTFLSDISLFDTPFLHLSTLPTVINFIRCNQFLTEIDSCCYGSDCVYPRNSCQSYFLVLTTFLHVIPVSSSFVPTTCVNSCWLFLFLPFQPQTCDTCWPLYSAIQRFLLVNYFGSSRLDQLYSWHTYITYIA